MTSTIPGQGGRGLSVLGPRPHESAPISGSDRPSRLSQPRLPSVGPGLRDLTFAFALADAAERMHKVSNVADLWAAIVSEAVLLIPAEAAALIEYRQGSWRLLESQPSDAYPSIAADEADVAAIVEHGLLAKTGSIIEPSSLPSTNGISWPALLIARFAGLSRRNPIRLVWFSRSPAAFSDAADIAGIFTRHADAALQSARARDTLSEAIAARHHIGIAQGLLMSRYRWTAAQAFSVLQQLSHHTNVKVRSVADQVIEIGGLPEPTAPTPQAQIR